MVYRRRLKYYLIKLCRLHDSPKSVAGGFAWGTVIHFYPTCGFGALFAVAFARLFSTNLVSATLAWAITMPLFPLFFYLNYVVGHHIIYSPVRNAHVLAGHHIGLHDILFLGKAFVIGSFLNGIIGVVFLWWLGYILLKKYRKKALSLICRIF